MTPNRTDNRTQSPAEFLEQELQEAHLLCVRREYAQAKALLTRVNVQFPGNREVQYLLARIAATEGAVEAEAKEEVVQSRALRCAFNLQTTRRRIGWAFCVVVLVVQGAWCGATALVTGFARGFATRITTMVFQGTRRYGPGQYALWTRPVYVDLIYSAAVIAAALFMGFILWRASRGIAQWEELDAGADGGRCWP